MTKTQQTVILKIDIHYFLPWKLSQSVKVDYSCSNRFLKIIYHILWEKWRGKKNNRTKLVYLQSFRTHEVFSAFLKSLNFHFICYFHLFIYALKMAESRKHHIVLRLMQIYNIIKNVLELLPKHKFKKQIISSDCQSIIWS